MQMSNPFAATGQGRQFRLDRLDIAGGTMGDRDDFQLRRRHDRSGQSGGDSRIIVAGYGQMAGCQDMLKKITCE